MYVVVQLFVAQLVHPATIAMFVKRGGQAFCTMSNPKEFRYREPAADAKTMSDITAASATTATPSFSTPFARIDVDYDYVFGVLPLSDDGEKLMVELHAEAARSFASTSSEPAAASTTASASGTTSASAKPLRITPIRVDANDS